MISFLTFVIAAAIGLAVGYWGIQIVDPVIERLEGKTSGEGISSLNIGAATLLALIAAVGGLAVALLARAIEGPESSGLWPMFNAVAFAGMGMALGDGRRRTRRYEDVVKAANRGDALAQTFRGICYESGQEVGRVDYCSAAYWYGQAAEQNFARAQFHLGRLHLTGLGTDQDPKAAAALFQSAARAGHHLAQAHLGHMHLRGLGVERDLSKAAKWLNLAVEQSLLQDPNVRGQWVPYRRCWSDPRLEKDFLPG